MSVECHNSRCLYHDSHSDPDSGPFCYEEECRVTELKLCPFCGGEAKIARVTTGGLDEITIGCAACSITCYAQGSVEQDVIKAWNTRVPKDNQ